LASGQQASITGTMAGQIVMEGMVRIRLRPWKRRLLTRFVALVPAVVITAVYPNGAANLLILSQVILSLTLSFCTPSRLKFDGGRW
jgi:manganese transport protein